MPTKHLFKLITILLIFIFFAIPKSAHAYLDPGTGSYLIQIAIASLTGFGFIIKANWKKLKNALSKKTKKNEKEDNSS